MSSDRVTTYYGTPLWSPSGVIRAKSVDYLLARGKTLREALDFANGLLGPLRDFGNLPVLALALRNAQTSGIYSPFVSTTLDRRVALSFALADSKSGYCVTVEGPRGDFFDFNGVRTALGIPHEPTFKYLKEMGIPLELQAPFLITRVDLVTDILEEGTCVYEAS